MSTTSKYPTGSFAAGDPKNGPLTFHTFSAGHPVPSVGQVIEMEDGTKRKCVWVDDIRYGYATDPA